MKRITADQVKEAFKATGLKPRQGSFFSIILEGLEKVNCACGLGAIYMHEAKNPTKVGSLSITNYLDETYGVEYRAGFAHGFDDANCAGDLDMSDDRFRQGYEDGKVAREAMFEDK